MSRDDVDVFCVTQSGKLWFFVTKALIIGRVSEALHRSSPPICLSCIMDLDFAEVSFSKDNGALFARDALVAKVVRGGPSYTALLRSANWMKQYFPKLYSYRTENGEGESHAPSGRSAWTFAANRFLFHTIGFYVRAKARFHNHILSKSGKAMSSFRAKAGVDHLIYESTKYQKLRDVYSEIRPLPEDSEDKRLPLIIEQISKQTDSR